MGQRLLNKFGGLTGLHRAPIIDVKINNMDSAMAQAARIKAVIELGRRLTLELPEERPSINAPADAAALVSHEMSALEQAHLPVILIAGRNRVTETVEVY